MVARAGGYYRNAFGGKRGLTQGDPLSPTIFNVVVDGVVRHWVHRIMKEAGARGETGRESWHQAALFYANDGMVTSLDPAWLQGAFTALVGLFDRVVLQKKCREYCQHGLPPLPGNGGKQNTRVIWGESQGRGEVLHGVATRTSGMRGVWIKASGRVNVESSDDLTWESGGAKTPMDTIEGDRVPDIKDVLPY